MTRRVAWPLLVGIGVVVLVVVGLLAWRFLGPGRGPATPVDFVAATVPVDSPNLALEAEEVRGVVREGHTLWSCRLRCREATGCHAQLRVTVYYRSGGSPKHVVFADAVQVERGETVMLGGLQRPPLAVDAVERVAVAVEQRLGGRRPNPITYQ